MAYRYAESTAISSGKSRDEIERTLAKYGATSFAYGWQHAEARIMFEMADRQMLFVLPLPDRSAKEFWYTPSTRVRRSIRSSAWTWAKKEGLTVKVVIDGGAVFVQFTAAGE